MLLYFTLQALTTVSVGESVSVGGGSVWYICVGRVGCLCEGWRRARCMVGVGVGV